MLPTPTADLSGDERRALREALRRPRGRYEAVRAAQLSGVPQRTVCHWAKEGTLVPDYGAERPKTWSYRDLVYLRLTAFLRGHGVDLADVRDLVATWRRDFATASDTAETEIHTDGVGVSVGPMVTDLLTGQVPFDTLVGFTGRFDLLDPVDRDFLGGGALWGPSLVRPSKQTAMSPWVMSGEPCIRQTRIPTGSLYVMHVERGLSADDLAYLYPDATVEAIDDAISLESRLRHAA